MMLKSIQARVKALGLGQNTRSSYSQQRDKQFVLALICIHHLKLQISPMFVVLDFGNKPEYLFVEQQRPGIEPQSFCTSVITEQ